jgi:hypothetical protein
VSTHYFRFSRQGAVDRQRSPLLERLLARADASAAVADWRRDAYRIIAPDVPMPGIAAAMLFADSGPVDAVSVFLATPVHYLAEMSNVRLPADGILSLNRSEADALALDFNRVWDGAGIRLVAGGHADLFCVIDEALDADTEDPENALDGYIENHLPGGADAARLRRLMSEIEMWLFEHAVNRARVAQRAAVVNALWLWGGGRTLVSLPPIDGWTAGGDRFFNAFAAAPEHEARPGSAAAGVVAVAAQPGTHEWSDLESRWLVRSLADLKSGRITRLDLSAGSRCFSVSARGNRRLWRRRRPWWESFT